MKASSSSKVSKDTKTVDDEERRVKEITNSAIQATAKRSQEYCNTYAEEEMKKLVAEEKQEDEKGMVSAKEEEEDDIQERLDAIIRESTVRNRKTRRKLLLLRADQIWRFNVKMGACLAWPRFIPRLDTLDSPGLARKILKWKKKTTIPTTTTITPQTL